MPGSAKNDSLMVSLNLFWKNNPRAELIPADKCESGFKTELVYCFKICLKN